MKSALDLCVLSVRRIAPLVLLMVLGASTLLHAVQTAPTITWAMPTPFVYGSSIPVATATVNGSRVAGTFSYSPARSTRLHVTGNPVTCTVTFTPNNRARYSVVTKSVTITVIRAPLTVTANASKVYNATVRTPTPSYSGFKFGDRSSVLTGSPAITHSVIRSSPVGTYPITVGAGTLSASDYRFVPVNGVYTVRPATASITLSNLTQAYNGSPRTVTVATNPTGLPVSVTYAGSPTAPTNVGSYAVVASIASPNYTSPVQSGTLTITPVAATIELVGLAQVYDGTPRIVTATSNQPGMAVTITYDGATTAPTNAGSYAIVAVPTSANYVGSVSGTLVVSPASATVVLGNLAQTYSGSPLAVTATTTPDGLPVTVTYDGSAAAPTDAGTYAVVATVNSNNHTANTASGSLVIAQAPQVITFATLLNATVGDVDQALTASASSGLPVGFTVTGPATIVAGKLHVTGAGTVIVTATQPGDGNYLPALPVVQSITVTEVGTGLLASYFANEMVSGTPVLTRLESQINYDWASGSPAPGVPADSFSARWDGEIQTRFAEAYTLTFRTDDGVRVWLDGQLIVNYWNLRSAADSNYTFTAEANRRYRVRIEYYEHTGLAVAKLWWRSASEPSGPIPTSQLFPTLPDTSGPVGSGTGLTAAYFTNETLTGLPALSRVDAGVNFDWAGGSPASGIPADSFSVRWSGEIQPRYTEPYTLVLRTDDGVRVWLDGQLVINDWILRGAANSTCTFNAVAGQRYAIRIEYYEHQGSAVSQMSWYSAREFAGPVPAAQLYPVPLPVANNDLASTVGGVPASIAVLANDVSADASPLRVASVGVAANGTTAISQDLLSVTYTPSVNFIGSDMFSYVLVDGHGRSAIGYVTVTVQSPAELVLHWKFDEQTGTVARDSARAHHATIYGGTRVPGKQSGAVALSSGIIQAGDAADMHLQRMTIALWMKPSQTFASMGGYAGLFDRLDWATNSGFYFGSMGTNQIAFMLMNGPDQESRVAVGYDEAGSGDWVHVAAVYDGGSIVLYRNGVVVASQVVGALAINYQDGWPLNAGGGYAGVLDDVRVYDRALSAAELALLVGANPDNAPPVIAMGPDRSVTLPATAAISAVVSDDGRPAGAVQLTWSQIGGPATAQFSNTSVANPTLSFTAAGPYVLRLKASDGDLSTVADVYVTVFAPDDVTRGLVGHWKFDESAGAIAADSSGRHHDALITNGPAVWEPGYLGKGQHFAGTDHLAMTADGADLRVQQLAVSAWVRADRSLASMASPYPLVLSKQDWEANGGFFFGAFSPHTDDIGLRLMTGADAGLRIEMQVPHADAAAWHHVCAVYDGSYLRIYRDGEEMPGSLRVGPLIINHSSAPVIMGQGFEGLLDDVRLYDRPLSPSEVDSLAGTPPSGSG